MPRPRSNLAPRILEAARKRMLVEGVDGASLRQIAADAGTTIGMVYYYYPTKDDLFLAVVESVYANLLVDAEKALAPDVPAEQRLERMYARLAAASDVEFDVMRIIIREALVSSQRLEKIAERMLQGHIPWLLRTFADGRAEGRFDSSLPLPLQIGATMAIGVIPQLVLRRLRDAHMPVADALPPANAVPKLLIDVLLHGLGGAALPARSSPPSSQQE